MNGYKNPRLPLTQTENWRLHLDAELPLVWRIKSYVLFIMLITRSVTSSGLTSPSIEKRTVKNSVIQDRDLKSHGMKCE